MTGQTTRPQERTWLGWVSAFFSTLLLATTGGFLGLFAGVAVVTCWYLLPSTYAFALGNIALAAGVPDGAETVRFALIEVGLLGILIGPALRFDRGPRLAAVTGGCFLALLGVTWAGQRQWNAVWLTVLLLVEVVGLTAYGLHRYDVVAIRLGSDTHE